MSKISGGRFLTFLLKGETYGVPIHKVREINQMMEITPVPKTPPSVEGVVNLRGKILPVVNLREKLSFERAPYDRETCIVILETQMGPVGIIVDAVREVADLNESQMEVPPQMGQSHDMKFLSALGKLEDRVIIILDVDIAFSDTDLNESMSDLPHVA